MAGRKRKCRSAAVRVARCCAPDAPGKVAGAHRFLPTAGPGRGGRRSHDEEVRTTLAMAMPALHLMSPTRFCCLVRFSSDFPMICVDQSRLTTSRIIIVMVCAHPFIPSFLSSHPDSSLGPSPQRNFVSVAHLWTYVNVLSVRSF